MPQWEYCHLTNNGREITYGYYREEGLFTETQPFDRNLWGSSIAVLGLIGWEAISHIKELNETRWYFKRPFDPNNTPFSLS